jgi:DNA-binding MarR family transcriptional regulator
MAGPPKTGLFAVLHASSVLESRVEAKLSEVGLSIAKLAALHRLACVKSNVTQLVDRLESDGLVSRTSDPNDRRSRIAVLTDAGRKAYAKGSEIQRQAEQELFGALTSEESTTLHHLLEKLKA